MIVGLTGGIGAGKSVVAELLARRGAAVVDTDAIAREVVEPPSDVLDQIARAFGPSVTRADGSLDRAALARIVFSDEAQRRRLNEITHPEILKRVLARIGAFPPSTVVVVVVPLLFESGFDRNCQAVIAVMAPEKARIARVMARDGATEADVRARMRAQLAPAEYERHQAIVVHNDGDQTALDREVESVWRRLTQTSKPAP